MVQTVAPEALKAGYTFDVEVNNEILTVVVPRGGVSKGQTFMGQTQAPENLTSNLLRIPVGMWKDGLFEFCKYGPCHPSFFLSWWCPFVAIGQIYTRLGLSWNGTPYSYIPETSKAFKTMVGLEFVLVATKQFIGSMYGQDPAHVHLFFHLSYIINFSSVILVAIFAGRTRAHLREKYDIPATLTNIDTSPVTERCGCGNLNRDRDDENSIVPQCCDDVEDYCLSCFCYPCVISQMQRHTAMYDTYEGSCFRSDGLPKHAPSMI